MMLQSIRNPAIRRRLVRDRSVVIEEALIATHETIYRQYGWPSEELEKANRVCGFVFPLLRFARGERR
jgi:hypothetical protein